MEDKDNMIIEERLMEKGLGWNYNIDMEEKEYNKIARNINNEREYEIIGGLIYKIKDGKRLRVIRKYEFEGLMYIAHDHELSGHFGIDATYNRIKDGYYWKGMRKDVEAYVKSCNNCQRRGKPIGKHELNVIKVIEPFYQIGIDVVGPLPVTKRNNRYIVTAMDYFTKWPEAKALETADAKEIARFIYEDIICRHGLKSLMEEFQIKHNFSTPYHPKTNGLIESFNKTLCESLAKLSNIEDWDLKVPGVLFAYRTKRNDSTKMESGYLIYGRQMKTLLDLEDKEITMAERVNGLIEGLPNIRNQAKENVRKSQEKQKSYHDKKNRIKQKLQIGDKVLYYDAAKEKQWSGKLEEKWKGPYYVHEIISKGSYRIKTMEGKILKTPVNGELLKEYMDRTNFEVIVRI
ncbi:DDE-type integrase/transposase/recombinase [Rhizophagus irregularis DAOM 181602=DAOM 197198]|nr:DDE-type integrase/transposase/recombinase [Rhizophagus irregularis DAOM 181602=DAOM 197198]GBC29377.2 DDE-type integrase/transposase/recombinase [Rhizophagus irregularis DAOM 181602=DAOM 197198]